MFKTLYDLYAFSTANGFVLKVGHQRVHRTVIGSRKGCNPDDQLTNEKKERSPQDQKSQRPGRDSVCRQEKSAAFEKCHFSGH